MYANVAHLSYKYRFLLRLLPIVMQKVCQTDRCFCYDTTRPEYVVFDAYIHGVNLIQQTDGFQVLRKKMGKAHITRGVVFGFSITKEW